jgi:hypothetical protein
MQRINKLNFVKPIISILAIFIFNLPTFAALDINYKNLFAIPESKNSNSDIKTNYLAQSRIGTGIAPAPIPIQPQSGFPSQSPGTFPSTFPTSPPQGNFLPPIPNPLLVQLIQFQSNQLQPFINIPLEASFNHNSRSNHLSSFNCPFSLKYQTQIQL